MGVIYLIRHGQASFGSLDYDVLSDQGKIQSTVVGEELRRRAVAVDRVYSGTLARQRDTAEACLRAAGIDLPVRQDERWNEYDHLALARRFTKGLPGDGMPSPRDFQHALDRALSEWVGGADGWADFSGRVYAALDELAGELGRGATALVFTSGGVIAAICTRLLDLPPSGFIALNRVAVNGAITKLVHGSSGTSLISFNDHAHFEGARRELLSYR